MFPIKRHIKLDEVPEQGRFGAKRRYDFHTGVDLYCESGTPVYAVETGIVVNVCNFTGEDAGSPWWSDTKAVLVEGRSGVILYGEIDVLVQPNTLIKEGTLIGNVRRVLKNDKGLPTTMLHMELYAPGYKGDGEWWRSEKLKPAALLNIEELLWP